MALNMSTATPSTISNYIYLYISQLYIIGIGIVIVPFHLKYIGVAAYGLIGIYTTVQVMFQMLDVGMTPTLSREASRLHVGAISQSKAKSFLRVLEIFFLLITLSIFLVAYFASDNIAINWFSSSSLDLITIQKALFYLTLVAGIRWYSGIYRAFIAGFENQVWLSKLNIIITTLRFVGVIPVLIYYDSSIVVFFQYQVAIAVIEVLVLIYKVSSYIIVDLLYFPSLSDIYKLKSTFKLSATAGGAGLLWVIASQSDKILLSKFLSLEDFGYFSMAVLLVNGVMVITAPITKIIFPKLTKLTGLGLNNDFNKLYLDTSRTVGFVAFIFSVFIFFYSYEIVYAWTADKEIANKIHTLVGLYALGNSFLALSSLTYYFQMAKGDVKLHVVGVFIYLLCINISLVFFVSLYGFDGAGYAWLLTNVIYFFLWCPFVIGKFNRDIVVDIFIIDFIKVVFPICLVFLVSLFIWQAFNIDSYIHNFIFLVIVFFTGTLIVVLAKTSTRHFFLTASRNIINKFKEL